ncbi:hypothetical protein DAERI_010498 [Deinococcus aerius]|uniref:Antitoxin n=1 Tax=Deinococcus aerius TaxID=200253 RepID=A0A2I9D1Q0_9DEIO|nr:hypothetical protein [Deinococcus aerius]GBF04326.1 hypothetical protein DAERI_010498 [Deinococcus aerius]
MTRIVDFEEFAAQMPQLLREAEAGETIVILRDGKPSLHIQGVKTAPDQNGTGMTIWEALRDAPKAETAEEELVIDRKADAWRNDHFEFDPDDLE